MGWDFKFSSAIDAMRRTAPFILLRLAVYFGIALLYVFAMGGGGAIGYGVEKIGGGEGRGGAAWGSFTGFAGATGVLYWIREYILYIVKAGHIAVLTKLYDKEPLPEGQGQIKYGSNVVKERFAQSSVLFAFDRLINGVIKAITGMLGSAADLLPIPHLDKLMKMVNAVIRMSLTYVDEIILANLIRTNAENPWSEGRKALVLYAQNYKSMIKNAVWLSAFMWILTLFIFLLFLAPAIALISIFPGSAGGWGWVVAAIFAWSTKKAIIEPIAMYCLMQVYFKKTEGQEPDPEWEARLDKASKHFRNLKDKAISVVSGGKPDKQPELDVK